MSTDFVDPLKLSEADDEEETSIQTVATDLMAWEYGADLPEVEVTPEQLDSAEALYMRDMRRYTLLTAQEEEREECDRDQNVYLGELFTRRLTRAVPDLLFLPASAGEVTSISASADAAVTEMNRRRMCETPFLAPRGGRATGPERRSQATGAGRRAEGVRWAESTRLDLER